MPSRSVRFGVGFERFARELRIERPVALRARPPDGRTARAVQHLELDAGARRRGVPMRPPESVDLAHELALGEAADRGIAGHAPDRAERRPSAAPCCRPIRAAACAASMPAWPPPMTRTSKSWGSSLGSRARQIELLSDTERRKMRPSTSSAVVSPKRSASASSAAWQCVAAYSGRLAARERRERLGGRGARARRRDRAGAASRAPPSAGVRFDRVPSISARGARAAFRPRPGARPQSARSAAARDAAARSEQARSSLLAMTHHGTAVETARALARPRRRARTTPSKT